MLQGSF